MPQSYKDLDVWKVSIQLVQRIYKLTSVFPREELFGLTSQMRPCAVSVPSNIAEGQGRLTPGEFKQFLSQARGSLMELETQLFISSTLGYVQREAHEELSDLIERLARMLNALISSIKVRAANAGNS